MKIRTKLLLTLAAISLVPPIAAYVALIGNPGIAFALHMNEYQAEQGLAAQRLQADLNALVSAVEESLSETYRAQVAPKEREDAERQRRLANTTVAVDVAAYAADLDYLARSEAKESHDIAAPGGEPSAAIVDRGEAALLNQLGESLPRLRANAARFVTLSDSASKQEGEFVQMVFEPNVRGDLTRTLQELVVQTDQGAQAYRRNIESALRDSYKETVLIVLAGIVVSIVLAAVISRGVIGPIQQLRDTALQLGQGRMDTRIPVHSADELGELASSFNVMADNLAKLIAERRAAQTELTDAHERLKVSMEELEARNREASALTGMADLLQSCFTLDEASTVIAASAQQIFPGFSGAVLVFSASRNVLEAATTWGRSIPMERIFSPNDCWALRRGRLHQSGGETGAVRCAHLGANVHLPSVCTPLMAHGETLGILCVEAEPDGPKDPAGALAEPNAKMAVSVAEQAALSFANLRLREKLRYQSVRDPLTGLFNRRYLDESLEREVPNAVRKKRSLGVVMLDVDRFKKFNDLFGHDAGDAVLRELGAYLAKFARHGDLACRYGGEEFTLILPESSLKDTRRRADELRVGFQQLSIKHRELVLGRVTLSLGVAALPGHGTTPAELLTAADRALLRAKHEGRDRVVVAEPGSQHHATELAPNP